MLPTRIRCLLINHDAVSFSLLDVEFQFFVVLVHLTIEADSLIAQHGDKLTHRIGHLLAADDAPVELVDLFVEPILLYVLGEDELTDIIVGSHEVLAEPGDLLRDVESSIRKVLILPEENIISDGVGDDFSRPILAELIVDLHYLVEQVALQHEADLVEAIE